MATIRYGPASYKQESFLKSNADIVIFGGGAGSGKSYCAALKLLKCVRDANFRCLILRKSFKQIKGAGGILDTIRKVHQKVYEFKFNASDNVIRYKSGAEIHLRPMSMQKHQDDIQGQQYSMIIIDEAQQISRESILYALSRLRSEWEGRHQLIMTCNPLPDTLVHDLVKPNLDDNGTPIEELSGSINFMLNRGGEILMFSNEKECEPYLFKGEKPLSVSFINANIMDNPILMKMQPDYVSKLQSLSRVERLRLLDGNWNVREESSGYYNESWISPATQGELLSFNRYKVRAWDFANTLASEENRNPDWTVGLLMGARCGQSKDEPFSVAVLDIVRDRRRFDGVSNMVLDTAEKDGKDVVISLPLDPGGASHFTKQLSAKLSQRGFKVILSRPTGGKVDRFALFSQLSEAGYVYMNTSVSWYKTYINELCAFDGTRNCKDDQVDASSDALAFINQQFKVFNVIRTGMVFN